MGSLLDGRRVCARPARAVTLATLAAWTVAAAVSASAPAGAAIGSRARRASDSRWGITVEAPPGWTIAQRTGFVETIFALLSPDGSRITLSAQTTLVRSTAELVEQNRQGLARQGFVAVGAAPGPGGWRSLDLEVPKRDEKLRQLYLVRPGAKENQALVLTLVTPAKAFSLHVGELAFVVERMSIEDPRPPAPEGSSGSGVDGGTPRSRGRPGIEPRQRDAGAEHPGEP